MQCDDQLRTYSGHWNCSSSQSFKSTPATVKWIGDSRRAHHHHQLHGRNCVRSHTRTHTSLRAIAFLNAGSVSNPYYTPSTLICAKGLQ